MALIFDQVDDNVPQTHILIIGVGSYPYLNGGEQSQQQSIEYLNTIGQLTSPVHSAAHLCQTAKALHTMDAWIRPLGSIEVLTDIPIEGFDSAEVEQPTRQNISRAYSRWKKRCNTNRQNVAFFYFAGHGYGGPAEHYILSADVGVNPDEPLHEGIDFNRTRMAFYDCEAQTQIFLVDTCRTVPLETLLREYRPNPLYGIDSLRGECDFPLTMVSTVGNRLAYGPKNAPSFFASAVAKGLTSYGAENLGGEWKITFDKLRTGINDWMKLENQDPGTAQYCISQSGPSAEIIRLPSAPRAVLHVDMDPNAAMAHANITCRGKGFHEIRGPLPHPWELELDMGLYSLDAIFPGDEYASLFEHATVNPPMTKLIMRW